ncbi:MAG: hypothetical protein ABEI75_05435 [Halobaculum sp.]
MRVRDAVEADAAALAAIADAPADAMRRVIHDRTVRVAESDATATDPNEDAGDAEAELLGFVSFDARAETVHVTQFDGTRDACERLVSEPLRFAANEGMAVELLVVDGQRAVRDAVTDAGFERVGSGPRFDGSPTTRYRMESP